MGVLLTGCNFSSANITKVNYNETKRDYLSAYADCKKENFGEYLEKGLNDKLRQQNILGKDLKISCMVLDYDEGDRFTRYMVGPFGARTASAIIKVALIDSNNNEVQNFEVNAKLTGGAFGGDAKVILQDAIEKIYKYIREHYIK